jgi:hypothetical protein
MANTYYKYVDREVDSQVNWAEIGKSMTDMLSNEAKVREDKKAALDQATRDELKVLADQPTGQSESARAMAIKYGDNASQYLRMQDQLLKSGQLKLSDYMVTRQNIVDDTDNLFGMLKDYQAAYGEKMDRYKKGESQEWELAAMEMVEGFGNFSESGAFIDPATGRVSMAMMDKKMVDGKEVYTMAEKPGKTASIATVKGMLQGKWDKFNTNGALDAINASIGENIQTIRQFGKKNQAGEIMSVTDVLASTRSEAAIEAEIKIKQAQSDLLKGNTDKKSIDAKAKLDNEITASQAELNLSKAIFSFKDFETNAINQNFTNEWNRLSVLTNSMGLAPDKKPYKFVYSAEEQAADPVHNIYMKPSNDNNGSLKPSFTKQQEEASVEFMRNQLRGRYDYKESRQTVNEYQPAPRKTVEELKYWDDKKNQEAGFQQWNKLRTGTLEEKAAAITYFRGIDPNIKSVGFTANGGGVEFVYNNGAKVPYYFYDKRGTEGGELSGESWMNAGNEILGKKVTQDQARKYGTGAKTKLDGEEGLISISGQDGDNATPATGGGGGVNYSTK